MQAHDQIPGQVAPAQLSGVAQQSMTSIQSQGAGRRRTWQTEADVSIRRMIVEKILLLFQKRKPRVSPEWQQRLPDFVKRLEESLYRDAPSKEEYSDLSTLEQRLQAVAKRIGPMRTNPNVAVRGMNVASSSMIPTPGAPSVLSGSTMIPTPGHESTMVPTPGTSAVNIPGIGPPSGMTGSSLVTAQVVQPHQQAFNSGLNGHMYRNMNSQLGGNLTGNIQRGYVNGTHGMQLVNNGQPHLSNGSLGYSNASLYMNSGNLNIHQISQRQQHMPTQLGDGFGSDLTGAGAFYNTGMPSSSLGMPLHGQQASKMIPVPGLPSQTSNMQPQPQSLTQGKISGSTKNQQQLLNTKSSLHVQNSVEADSRKQIDMAAQDNGIQSTTNTTPGDGQSQQSQNSQKTIPQQQRHLSNEPRQQPQVTQQMARRQVGQNSDEQKQQQNDLATNQISTASGNSSNAGNPVNTDDQKAQLVLKQQRWLLFLRHASKCSAPEGQCQMTPHCHSAKQLWGHINKCNIKDCQYPRCQPSRTLLRHHCMCKDPQCPVCIPVRQKSRMMQGQSVQASNTTTGIANTSTSLSGPMSGMLQLSKSQAVSNTATDVHSPPAKRAKVESVEQTQSSCSSDPQAQITNPIVKSDSHSVAVKVENDLDMVEGAHSVAMAAGVGRVKPEEVNHYDDDKKTHAGGLSAASKSSTEVKQDVKEEPIGSTSSTGADSMNNLKSNKSKNKGVSLIELFTPEQIKEHITSLRQWVGQSKAKAEKNQAMEQRMNENSCQLCAVETLTFDPPPLYCTPCGARIKRNALYWTMQCGETRHYICIPCYNDARNDTVEVEGQSYPKSKLERRKNDEEIDEPWVQCDKCEKWQHQICALFNMRRNEGGQAEYTCPHCLLDEMRKGERKPLPQSSVLGAKDLPKTVLSDHIEQRLAKRLKSERQERAKAQGKSYDEVPGADSLVIRVVSSVDKKLEVKPKFLEIFQEEDYPIEFPYKSKVLLLFQKIEGVEVCLFGMYVQEFGAESSQPNQRRVYLSYLDSVKYFRPEVKTINGEALRTFVYHEILIAYLDYCKSRGFTSCYIWACPPLKGEDYILYCHPEIQKTPKSDKLREWYLKMLSKAENEGIVVEVTNMYDHFFVCTGESRAKVTATRLPYFDGDYWPGAAEDMIMQLQDEECGRRQQKKGKTKSATKRSTKTAAHAELANNASKDLQLMQKLGESIFPMKEDFIMVHMQYACTHCCSFILSGNRWTCKQCQNFNLCERCYSAEQKHDEWERHPTNSKEAHVLVPVESIDNLADTKDKDEIMESEFFDTRQAFLSLCQGNHYQYDTLRRAKNSSMMVLYHLHNPTAPAYVTTCNICHRDIETGQGWRCETCPDFDICNACHSKDDSIKHPHKLVPHPSAAERDAQSKEARQQRVLQLRKMLDLLVHASQCCSPQCQYPNCRRVKGLFRHGMTCRVRASGGCHLCKKMWYLLQLHARACKEAECRVPRCKDLKEHLRRLQQQMESRRRAAVMEMMRQRTLEATAKNS